MNENRVVWGPSPTQMDGATGTNSPERQKRASVWLTALVGLLAIGMAILGPAALWFLTIDMRTAQEAKAWPTTEGQITSSELRTCLLCDGPKYSVHITYQYVVDSHQLIGKKAAFGSASFDDQREADALLKKFPRGSVTKVYYNPSDPAQAVLEPRFAMAMTDVLMIGGTLAFDAWLVWRGVKFGARRLWPR